MNKITFESLGDRTFQTFVNDIPIKGLINIEIAALKRVSPPSWQVNFTIDLAFEDTRKTAKYLEKISKVIEYQFPVDETPRAIFAFDLAPDNAQAVLEFLNPRKYRHRPCFDTFDHELRKLCDLYGVKVLLTHANGEVKGLTLIDVESISLPDERLNDHRFNIKLNAQQLLTLIGGKEINISS